MHEQHYDVIIIGAGLGGLLSAAQLVQRGKRVAIVERLPHSGGRFTAKTFQGAQISTGAVHMVPFGSSGVLARMLRRLHISHRFFDADVFGSFHVHGKRIRSRGLLGLFRVFGPRQFFWFTRIGYLMFLRRLPQEQRNLPFDQWLEHHIDVKRNPELAAFFACISRFALSLELRQVSTEEVIKTTKNMLRFGAPAIVEGGCGALTKALEQYVLERGGDLRLHYDVLQILQQDDQVIGVRARDKANHEESLFLAPLIVSDIGPRSTDALLHNRQITQSEVLKLKGNRSSGTELPHEAIGLKVHVLSDVSLIPHKGIMYCLDTQRIAGIVQPTNFDPGLAPAGKHLLISHQVIQSEDIEEEKKLALADLRMLFGEAFEKHCRILTMSAYRGEWPVNRLAQGADVTSSTSVQGLYLVGDAVKPSGYLMVEGVAQSVNHVLDLLDSSGNGGTQSLTSNNIISPPSRLNALRWLWRAPGNARKSQGYS
ncbi:MAG TPA: NAD(P)/FAD-dependent oxidoreductase [Ktedonobacteraceae bacterium]|nr:NAD(P)/FAD-dependent oxidoreductase [Ktedonobacteraceae bacterium]